MKFIIRNITLLILFSIVNSCNGQVEKKEKLSLKVEKASEVNKIPVPKNGFSNAYLDKDGTLWFSSNAGGVYHYNGKTFKHYTEKNGLSSNRVFSIVPDLKNNLWFGTQNGLTKYDRKQFKHIPLPYRDTLSGWAAKMNPVLSPNAVHSLATDKKDNLWIGTAGGGAYFYDGTNFKSYLTEIGRKQEDSLYHNWIPFIRKDSKGNMWFASMTHGGVSRYDGETFTHYMPEDGLSDDMVRTIYEDRFGKIWIGFNGNRASGLTVYDGNSFKTYSVDQGLCNQRVRVIYEDKNGNLWLGSHLGNLCIFDGQNFSEFSSNGQSYSSILFILGDLEDNVWFGGSDGLWKFDGELVIKMTK
jgi:ligand-binding sensor domain-containing protein